MEWAEWGNTRGSQVRRKEQCSDSVAWAWAGFRWVLLVRWVRWGILGLVEWVAGRMDPTEWAPEAGSRHDGDDDS